MPEISLTFQFGELNLQGVLHLPRENSAPVPGVVLCHPHSLYGGNMHNNVIMAASRALNKEEIAALRFNFRGVGSSSGTFDNGEGEQDDVRAALAALAAQPGVDAACLGLMGYSFGGMVALNAGSHHEDVRALAAVSPVVTPGILQNLAVPSYFTCGSADDVVSADALRRETAQMALPGTVEIVQGVDHFWGGHEAEMSRKVAAFFAGALCG